MTRATLIAKLRKHKMFAYAGYKMPVSLTLEEIERLISDLEYCDFAHKALEGGESPQTLKKQAI